MSEEHFDQLSPIDGVHQVQPDGSIPSVVTPTFDTVALPDPEPGEIRIPETPDQAEWDVAQPTLPPEYVTTPGDALAEQVAAQRAQLVQPGSNEFRGAPHFMRYVDGREVCGQDGEPYPCAAIRSMIETKLVEQQTPQNGQDAPLVPPTMAEAAAAAGLTLDEFMERLRASRDQ